MKTWGIGVFIGLATIVIVVAYAAAIIGLGFSARNQPSALEAKIARAGYQAVRSALISPA
jgi:hypothetical protein